MTKRSFLDEHDRAWLSRKYERLCVVIGVLVLVAFAVAYWQLALVIAVLGGIALAISYAESKGQPNRPRPPSTCSNCKLRHTVSDFQTHACPRCGAVPRYVERAGVIWFPPKEGK